MFFMEWKPHLFNVLEEDGMLLRGDHTLAQGLAVHLDTSLQLLVVLYLTLVQLVQALLATQLILAQLLIHRQRDELNNLSNI